LSDPNINSASLRSKFAIRTMATRARREMASLASLARLLTEL
jgi:hypothetical protein